MVNLIGLLALLLCLGMSGGLLADQTHKGSMKAKPLPPTRAEKEVTQRFSDIRPTRPRPDEITAPAVNQDTSFPPLGDPVQPGPPEEVDADFGEDGVTADGDPPVEALFQANIAAAALAVASTEGRWRPAGRTDAARSLDVGIHAALLRSTILPSGAEIFYFAGDDYSRLLNERGLIDHGGLFKIVDPSANLFSIEHMPAISQIDPNADLFCSGHAVLADGRLLVAGGTERWPQDVAPGPHRESGHYSGIKSAFLFDPKTNTWAQVGDMNAEPTDDFQPKTTGGGRWYPSLLGLNSGEVLAFWGHPDETDTRHTNNTPEYFQPQSLSWQILGRESDVDINKTTTVKDPVTHLDKVITINLGYPRVHLLPNGRVFRATPAAPPGGAESFNSEINPVLESLTDRNDISVRVRQAPETGYGTGDNADTSVLLPLTPAISGNPGSADRGRYRARILLAGGINSNPQLVELGTRLPATGEPLARWTLPNGKRDPAMINRPRLFANATILPTGEVFVSGGKGPGPLKQSKVLEGEIFDPFKDTWRTVAPATVAREYHSVALLMPDGRVWHAGTSPDFDVTPSNQETRIELYEPWYYTATRPIIGSMTGPEDPIYPGAPVMHLHDSGLTVVVAHFRTVTKFALLRAASVTHAFNSDQRYIELESELVSVGSIFGIPLLTFQLTSPPSSSIAPPGNYLLFALDDRGVPSVGRFIRIDRQFSGELTQEAEDFTSQGSVPVSVNDNGTISLEARTEPFELFPRLEYGGIDFGPVAGTVTQFSANVSSPAPSRVCASPGQLVARLDRPDGPQIASLQITRSSGALAEQTTSVIPTSGVHNVFITFSPGLFANSACATVDWFKFKP